MKNVFAFLFIVALLGSSCSSKIGIAKRKYGKGYYVSVSHKPKSPVAQSQTQKPAARHQNEAVTTLIVPASAIPEQNHTSASVASAKVLNFQGQKPLGKATQAESKALTADANKTYSNTSKLKIKALQNLPVSSKSNQADDTNTILLVILCLFPFINLIAVYLKQGKKITNDFWITLILDFTLVLGVIYSILVVLDVMSFA